MVDSVDARRRPPVLTLYDSDKPPVRSVRGQDGTLDLTSTSISPGTEESQESLWSTRPPAVVGSLLCCLTLLLSTSHLQFDLLHERKFC